MEPVPAYLLLYLLKIRKHSGELGYLERRFERVGLERALDEKEMLRELCDLELIGLTKDEQEVSFDQSFVKAVPGLPVHGVGEPDGAKVAASLAFVVAVRGKYIWVELLLRYFAWVLTALVCGFAGGLALDAQGDHFNAWVVAVLACLLLPALACLVLVKENPRPQR